jgi:competence protein ComEC
VLDEPAASLGAGILLGAKSGLPSEIEDAFATTGIIHIVVLSGYNIMLVVVFVLTIGSYCLSYRWRLMVAIIVVLLFGLMVGFAPSVARACLMAVVVLVSYVLGRPQGAWRALALAAVVIVCINPYTLRYDIGFQFSFMATVGLIAVVPVIEKYFTITNRWAAVQTLLVATLATQIAVMPLLLYHIGIWSIVALPMNLIVVPLVPIAMGLTFLTVLLGFVALPLASISAFVAQIVLGFIISLATIVASWPLSSVTVPVFSPWWLLVAYSLLGYGYYYLTRRVPKGNQGPVSSVDVRNWTIVEETTLSLPQAQKKLVVDNATTESPDTVPIFFR